MQQIPYIYRNNCVVAGVQDLEPIGSFKKFPVYMGCVDSDQKDDIFSDMQWMISKSSGCIQLNPLLPPELVYLREHNDSTGQIWKKHHTEFADFISKFHPRHVLEIGGAHGILGTNYLAQSKSIQDWTIVEPNPVVEETSRLKIIKGFFGESLKFEDRYDAVIHSHCFEHAYNPLEFIEHINNVLPVGGLHLFSVPDLVYQLTNKMTSCLNFEHTFLLSKEYIEYILGKYGFIILETYDYMNHSRFYATRKTYEKQSLELPNFYPIHREMFKNFTDFLQSEVMALNEQIRTSHRPVYLFGAHIFTQYLLNFGLDLGRVVGVLDNSPLKIGKRLYGSNLWVHSPKILEESEDALVVLKASFYSEEIMRDIKENINANVNFLT